MRDSYVNIQIMCVHMRDKYIRVEVVYVHIDRKCLHADLYVNVNIGEVIEDIACRLDVRIPSVTRLGINNIYNV